MLEGFVSWMFRFLLFMVIAQFIFHLTMEAAMFFFKSYLDEKHPQELRKKGRIYT
ncbi:MAG TPA: hypothetical protein VJG90_05550 [Candidatus Nanoarchaeia archaeon]|nr:hypothetical protein [Candidatus Nanoarchaeia archaeon]